MRLHKLGAVMAVVELVRGTVRVPALGEYKNVWLSTEGVGEDSNGFQVDIGILSGSLPR
jgi:hypothetical protein